MNDSSRPWRSWILLPFCVLLAFSCSHGGPTEPTVNRVHLDFVLTPGFASTAANSVEIQSDFCSCTKAPVTVSINSTIAGTLGCGETKSFPTPGGTFDISVQSPEIYPLSGRILIAGVASDPPSPIPAKLACLSR